MSAPMIEMSQVNKYFGAFQVLKDVNLAVGRGEPPAHVINPEAMPIWRMKA